MSSDVKPAQPTPAEPTPQPQPDGRAGLVMYVVELVQKLPPAALLVLAMGALFWINRTDMKEKQVEQTKAFVDSVDKLNKTMEDQGRDLKEAAREAHSNFSQELQRNRDANKEQWQAVRASTDMAKEMQRDIKETQASIKTMIEEVKRLYKGDPQ